MREKETLRYLGFHGHDADEQTLVLMEECFRELEQVAAPKYISREYPLKIEGIQIDMTCLVTESRNLEVNLRGCDSILLFAATLGSQVDVLLRKYETLQISKAVVIQAAAAAMLEEYCDEKNSLLEEEYKKQKRYLRPRFSPGYGDFSLECQRAISSALELNKRIGITLTDSLLMVPTKSVTAVIGVSSIPCRGTVSGCESCDKGACAYRRNKREGDGV